MSPEFLTRDQVLAVHSDQIRRYGGSLGLRDAVLFDSAIAQPAATFDGRLLHPDIYSMAAAYLFHLVKNHPFVDGNKRVGTATALVFLVMNGFVVDVKDDELVNLVLGVAEGRVNKDFVAEFFRSHLLK